MNNVGSRIIGRCLDFDVNPIRESLQIFHRTGTVCGDYSGSHRGGTLVKDGLALNALFPSSWKIENDIAQKVVGCRSISTR